MLTLLWLRMLDRLMLIMVLLDILRFRLLDRLMLTLVLWLTLLDMLRIML
jgi:hypothetical protein